jgi:hypothetical protein
MSIATPATAGSASTAVGRMWDGRSRRTCSNAARDVTDCRRRGANDCRNAAGARHSGGWPEPEPPVRRAPHWASAWAGAIRFGGMRSTGIRFVTGHNSARRPSSVRRRNSAKVHNNARQPGSERNSAKPRNSARPDNSAVRRKTAQPLSDGRPHSSAKRHVSVRRPASHCRRMSCAMSRRVTSAISGRWRAGSSPAHRRSSPARDRSGHPEAWAHAAASAVAVDAVEASEEGAGVVAASTSLGARRRSGEDTCRHGHAIASTGQKSRWTRMRPSHVSSEPVDRNVPVGSPDAVVSGTATRSCGTTRM